MKYIKNDITPMQYKAQTKMFKPMGLISSKYVTLLTLNSLLLTEEFSFRRKITT
jgi:hypothetical protein